MRKPTRRLKLAVPLYLYILKIKTVIMKEFKKNEQGLFVCEECGKKYADYKNGLCHHIYKCHNAREYYDKWIKLDGENLCQICKLPTKFIALSGGYKNTCSSKCSNEYRAQKIKKSVQDKYDVDNVYQIKTVKDKRNTTMKIRYGAEQASNCECLKEKRKQTFINIWGVNAYVITSEFKQKRKMTMLKKYGVENNSQNIENFEKGQKTRLTIKQFKNTNVWYQGSYELDFLEKYHDKFSDIKRSHSIKYIFENKNKVYHPDFYIPSLNLIIECKNKWLYERDKIKIEAKKKATIANGFNYIIILDKDYNDFNMLSSS